MRGCLIACLWWMSLPLRLPPPAPSFPLSSHLLLRSIDVAVYHHQSSSVYLLDYNCLPSFRLHNTNTPDSRPRFNPHKCKQSTLIMHDRMKDMQPKFLKDNVSVRMSGCLYLHAIVRARVCAQVWMYKCTCMHLPSNLRAIWAQICVHDCRLSGLATCIMNL